MSRTAIIQLARYGDLVNILPIAYEMAGRGHDVSIYVHPDFAPILEAVSYVTPVLWDVGHRDVAGAAEHARQAGFDEVLAVQVDGNKTTPPIGTHSFQTEPWVRAGFVDAFHDLPLVFDRRDREGEQRALRKYWPATDKPVLAYCLKGRSSPFFAWRELAEWLPTLGDQYQLLDLGALELDKPHHLLAFIERADVLLTIDTLPVLLAQATRTPTINLCPEREWNRSEPRDYYVGRVTYDRAVAPEGKGEIERILRTRDFSFGRFVRPPRQMTVERVHHLIDWFCPYSGPDHHRIVNARMTWEAIRSADRHWEPVWFETAKHAPRTSRELGDSRTLPYLRDLFDYACERVPGDGIVCFNNVDVCLCPEAPEAIREKLGDAPCCYGRRVDVGNAKPPAMTREEVALLKPQPGYDLFAFRKSWWQSNRENFPDMLLACEGWDLILANLMKRDNRFAELDPPVCYHQQHDAFWAMSKHRTTNPGQKHNRQLLRQWAINNEHDLYPDDSVHVVRA